MCVRDEKCIRDCRWKQLGWRKSTFPQLCIQKDTALELQRILWISVAKSVFELNLKLILWIDAGILNVMTISNLLKKVDCSVSQVAQRRKHLKQSFWRNCLLFETMLVKLVLKSFIQVTAPLSWLWVVPKVCRVLQNSLPLVVVTHPHLTPPPPCNSCFLLPLQLSSLSFNQIYYMLLYLPILMI
jgi:hypothetical protein